MGRTMVISGTETPRASRMRTEHDEHDYGGNPGRWFTRAQHEQENE